jgi:hypothetical protein
MMETTGTESCELVSPPGDGDDGQALRRATAAVRESTAILCRHATTPGIGHTPAPILPGAVRAVVALLGVDSLVLPPWSTTARRLGGDDGPWARWRAGAATLARTLPGGTHAERAHRRAVWAALEAADAAWEAGR